MNRLSTGLFILLIMVAQSALGSESRFSVDDKVFICNEKSHITHLRAGPSAKNRPITGYLPNSLPVTIQQLKTNTAGYLYYYLKLTQLKQGDACRHRFLHGDIKSH